MTLVNDDKANFIQDHCHKHKDDCNGIFSRQEILGSIPNTAWASGNLLSGSRGVDGKLLKGNIRGKENSC